MTIGDLIKSKNYDYVEYLWKHEGLGVSRECTFKVQSGKIISLNGMKCSKKDKVLSFAEWSNPEAGVYSGLTIVTDIENMHYSILEKIEFWLDNRPIFLHVAILALFAFSCWIVIKMGTALAEKALDSSLNRFQSAVEKIVGAEDSTLSLEIDD